MGIHAYHYQRRSQRPTSNTSQNFRVALVDSPLASRIAANGSPGSSTYTGYGMFMNMGAVLGNSNPFRLMEHDNNGALLSASGDWLPLANGATTGNTGYVSGTQYEFLMTITRTVSSDRLAVEAATFITSLIYPTTTTTRMNRRFPPVCGMQSDRPSGHGRSCSMWATRSVAWLLEIHKSKLTIAGQTAPGGITVWRYPMEISIASDVVVRHSTNADGDFNAPAPKTSETATGHAAAGSRCRNGERLRHRSLRSSDRGPRVGGMDNGRDVVGNAFAQCNGSELDHRGSYSPNHITERVGK